MGDWFVDWSVVCYLLVDWLDGCYFIDCLVIYVGDQLIYLLDL
jgi:hypothetical protein